MRLIRHRFRPLTARRVYCICGYPKSNQWHQGFTNEEDAEFSRAWAPQSPSKPGTVNIIDLVHADLDARDRMGTKKYGTTLHARNGRKPLIDAYQEALDLAMYLRQEIEERRPPHVTHKQVMDVIDRVVGERQRNQWFNAKNQQDAVAQAIVDLVETGYDVGGNDTHDQAMHALTWDAVFDACRAVLGSTTDADASGLEIADRACKALNRRREERDPLSTIDQANVATLDERPHRLVTHQQLVAVITTVSLQARRDLQMEPERYIEQLASAILNLING